MGRGSKATGAPGRAPVVVNHRGPPLQEDGPLTPGISAHRSGRFMRACTRSPTPQQSLQPAHGYTVSGRRARLVEPAAFPTLPRRRAIHMPALPDVRAAHQILRSRDHPAADPAVPWHRQRAHMRSLLHFRSFHASFGGGSFNRPTNCARPYTSSTRRETSTGDGLTRPTRRNVPGTGIRKESGRAHF